METALLSNAASATAASHCCSCSSQSATPLGWQADKTWQTPTRLRVDCGMEKVFNVT